MNLRTAVPLSILTLSLLIGAGAMKTYARQGDDAPDDNVFHKVQEVKLPPLTIGLVDMHKVFDASNAPALVDAKRQEVSRAYIQQVKLLDSATYLDQQELIEYLKIITTDTRTPQQEARLKELADLSEKRATVMDTLRVKKDADLTAADKRQMQDLLQRNGQFQQLLPNIQRSLQADGQAKVEAFEQDQMERLRQIAGKVAASRGIAHLWNSDSMVYSVNDLTAEVVRKVKK